MLRKLLPIVVSTHDLEHSMHPALINARNDLQGHPWVMKVTQKEEFEYSIIRDWGRSPCFYIGDESSDDATKNITTPRHQLTGPELLPLLQKSISQKLLCNPAQIITHYETDSLILNLLDHALDSDEGTHVSSKVVIQLIRDEKNNIYLDFNYFNLSIKDPDIKAPLYGTVTTRYILQSDGFKLENISFSNSTLKTLCLNPQAILSQKALQATFEEEIHKLQEAIDQTAYAGLKILGQRLLRAFNARMVQGADPNLYSSALSFAWQLIANPHQSGSLPLQISHFIRLLQNQIAVGGLPNTLNELILALNELQDECLAIQIHLQSKSGYSLYHYIRSNKDAHDRLAQFNKILLAKDIPTATQQRMFVFKTFEYLDLTLYPLWGNMIAGLSKVNTAEEARIWAEEAAIIARCDLFDKQGSVRNDICIALNAQGLFEDINLTQNDLKNTLLLSYLLALQHAAETHLAKSEDKCTLIKEAMDKITGYLSNHLNKDILVEEFDYLQICRDLKQLVEHNPQASVFKNVVFDAIKEANNLRCTDASFRDATKAIDSLRALKDMIETPNDKNVNNCMNKINDVIHHPRTKALGGALLAAVGIVIVATSITVACISFGTLSPLSIGPIVLSVSMIHAGLAMMAATVSLSAVIGGATLFKKSLPEIALKNNVRKARMAAEQQLEPAFLSESYALQIKQQPTR